MGPLTTKGETMTFYKDKLVLLGLLAIACVTECRKRNGDGCLKKCGGPGLCSASDFCVKGGGGLCCKIGKVEGACNGTVGATSGYKCVTVQDNEDEEPTDQEEESTGGVELPVPEFSPMHCHENADTYKTCKVNCPGGAGLKNSNVANKTAGFTTYLLRVGDEPMCFHAFLPESDQPMPVVVQIDARANGAKFGKY